MNRFDPLRKLKHVDEAVARFAGQPGTVFTHGVFDELRRADVAFLAEARQLGDRLVVAIDSDAGAPVKPRHHEGDRAFHVAALESVDTVFVLDQPATLALLARLRPAIYALPDDAELSHLAATALLHSWGGRAITLPFASAHPRVALAPRMHGTLPIGAERLQ